MTDSFTPIVSLQTRTCGICARTLRLDPKQPGWTPATYQGHKVWACPTCARTGRTDRPRPGTR
ncbi:hypothetical protein FSW04_20120 [Baekduia soli]|uniref:Uncharacterized protein n=1 Tax=Baekduia soli TaxID=496014 RepID=A0A5B8U996_9ACTN|nr:hypothetical protein [Baekduia soli]QEC49654.1 hypothetical protein FSW04_20120 [Baekduia soli]